MLISFAAAGTDSVEVQFSEPVELQKGQGCFSPAANWDVDDYVSFFAVIPANAPSSTPGTGNVDETDLGGGLKMYTENSSDTGSHTLDLALAVPTPVEGTGYWNADYETGALTGNALGTGDYLLLNVETTVGFLNQVPLGVDGRLDIEPYKVEWIHQNWKMKIEVTKNTAGAGKFSVWLLVFRKNNVF